MAASGIEIVPVGLRVEGRLVVVVGAGRIAARKATAYLDRGAVVKVVAPDWSEEMRALDVAERHERAFEPTDLDGAWFAVTATGIPDVDGAVFRAAEERRIWCNAADDPQHCSAILPAVVREGGITVSIATGGRSPAMASWLRRKITGLLDEPTLAAFERTAEVRDGLRAEGRPTEIPGWQEALDAYEADLRRRLAEAGGSDPA